MPSLLSDPDSRQGTPISPVCNPILTHTRLQSIDALRGLLIVFMLLDHVRETFYLHAQVSDPMDVATTPPDLFFSRMLTHVCAPAFVFLTGLSAFLYASRQSDGKGAVAAFLFKRGLILVLLEITLVNFAWTFEFPPHKVYLQVIWAIGLSMIALSILVWLPRAALIGVGVALVTGHNLLDGIHLPPDHALHSLWAVLHDRGWLDFGEAVRLRTSYPVLPWFGVIALGYAAGPWFDHNVPPQKRLHLLRNAGIGLLTGFLVIRAVNVYGDHPWHIGDSSLLTVMSFFNLTKYPPSLLFNMLTLGIGLLLLYGLERLQRRHGGKLPSSISWLTAFGSAPMFFYVLHLYVLKLLYLMAVAIWGTNHDQFFGFDSVGQVWLCMAVLTAALYLPVKKFSDFKARRRDITWLRFF